MPVPLDGLFFAILFWVVSSTGTFTILRRRHRGISLIGRWFLAMVLLFALSCFLFWLYEWMMGRT